MANTGLFGPHLLRAETIDAKVIGVGPGAYMLGRSDNSSFYVQYVGRSDTDLNSRLHQWIGEFEWFMYAFYPTVRDAFDKECRLYHDFPNRNNEVHPAKPSGTNYTCPVCGA